MESWTPDRVHRFKNILAFLITTFSESGFFMNSLEDYPPRIIEENFLQYLGPDLPTLCEYAMASYKDDELKCFDSYCEKWNSTPEGTL